MRIANNRSENFPDWALQKWQDIADLIAETIAIPAALIIKTENDFLEVLISSHSENNPYKAGRKEKRDGLYSETVIKTQGKLLVSNATKDKGWAKNPDLKLGMFAYLGFPLNYPDNRPFGTLCVLDNKERSFTLLNEKLILQFKNVIELDLALMQSFELKSGRLAASVVQETTERRKVEENLALSEERYGLLSEQSGIGIALYSPEGKILFFNQRALKNLGGKSEDFIGKTLDEVFGNTLGEKYRIRITEEIRLRENHIYEDYFESPSGKYWFSTTHSVVCDKKGKVIGVQVISDDITERKHAEQALYESQSRLNEAQKLAHIGVWDWDLKTDKVNWSNELYQIAGLDPRLPAPGFSEQSKIFTPQSWQLLKTTFDKTLKTGDEYQLELNLIHTDGNIRNVNAFGGVKLDAMGQINGLFGTLQDITDRKRSESMFKDIIEKNPMSIQILNMEGYAIQTNSAHTKLFGVSPPAYYSVFKDTQLIQQGFGELFERIKKGEVVYFPDSYFNVNNIDPSFPDFPVWIKAIGFTLNNNNGIPDRIVFIHENITERRQAEALLNDIIEKNPMSIQIVDKNGYTVRGNPAYTQLFGAIPPPDFSIFADLESKGPELEKLISRAKNGEIVHLPDIFFNAHDVVSEAPDIPLWIRALIFPLKDSSGKPERFVFMHENITERKTAEHELIAAKEKAEESDMLKSAFLANMSHEIRTPMNGILGFSELLKTPGLTGTEQREYIGIIEKSGKRMLNILNDIIDISKIEAGLMKIDLAETNINQQIEYIYTFFKPEMEAKGMMLTFRNSLPAKEAIITTDREKLYAILVNLVKNAIKYTEKGSVEFGYVTTGSPTKLTELQFYVRDTGIGIPKDRVQAIFERFIQADIPDKMARQGAGLGLTIAKSYVEMLGGKIWIESEEGIGSTFYFTLPYNTEPEVNNRIPDEGSENKVITDALQLKILIAEDDEISEKLISINVKDFSNEIIKAKTGIETVAICRSRPDIDLILMDIQMPDFNGYEASRQIRQFNRDVVIIAQTAFGLTGDREKAIEAGCNDYIAKPISKNELLALIKKYFKK